MKKFTQLFNYSHSKTARHSTAAWRLYKQVCSLESKQLTLSGLLVIVLSAPATDSFAKQLDRNNPLHDYYAMLSQFWGQVYARGGSTLYCGTRFKRHKSHTTNAEHVFPMSWVARALKCGRRNQCRRNNRHFRAIETDMHNIWPALEEVNKARSNYRPAMIRGERYLFGRCDFEVDVQQRTVEPRPAVRGKIARSMFYMQDNYGLYLQPQLVRLLKKWNHQHPPDAEEHRRNDIIETLQGRRNRFIDHPDLINTVAME